MSVDFRVYLVTDRTQTGGRPLASVVEDALKAGLRAVQVREKDVTTRELLALASALLTCCRRYGARLFINDRIDVVLAIGADGVHLRADSVPISVARRLLGRDRLIGASTHSVEDAIDAADAGADFVVLGPLYDTPSKRAFGAPLGLDPLREAASRCSIPVFGIGGIDETRAKAVRRAGGFGVAVISSILTAGDVGQATCALDRAVSST